MKKKTVITRIIAMLAAAALLLCCCACQQEGENSAEPSSSASSESSPALTEWDVSTVRWTAGTDLKFEVRVRDGVGYWTDPQDHDCCIFKLGYGKTVSLQIQGLDYENSFDEMISYFRSLNPAKLSVGKTWQTIIAVRNAENVEICSKLTDERCLTTKSSDLETAEEFFSNVMIKVEDEFYTALDPNEEFEEII